MNKSNYRQGNIEILRFIVSIIIMIFHLSYIGIERGNHPFSESWIYVEFFFSLMGYFTIVHFEKDKAISFDDKAKAAILYTKKRFLTFWPYILISLSLYYLVVASPFKQKYAFEDVIK